VDVDDWTVVTSVEAVDPYTLTLVQGRLEAHGIAAPSLGSLGMSWVSVRRQDLERARGILAQEPSLLDVKRRSASPPTSYPLAWEAGQGPVPPRLAAAIATAKSVLQERNWLRGEPLTEARFVVLDAEREAFEGWLTFGGSSPRAYWVQVVGRTVGAYEPIHSGRIERRIAVG
jgi:hypothetical protein